MALGQTMEQGKTHFKFQAANYLSSCIQGAHNSTPQHVHLNPNYPLREELGMERINATEHLRLREYQGLEVLLKINKGIYVSSDTHQQISATAVPSAFELGF